jgi:hypothetical protein
MQLYDSSYNLHLLPDTAVIKRVWGYHTALCHISKFIIKSAAIPSIFNYFFTRSLALFEQKRAQPSPRQWPLTGYILQFVSMQQNPGQSRNFPYFVQPIFSLQRTPVEIIIFSEEHITSTFRFHVSQTGRRWKQ